MHIYKIMPKEEWQTAQKSGFFIGSKVDIEDGFIHFSKKEQLSETARKHFQHQENLILVVVESDSLDQEKLRFEVSRGGALFPHLYGTLSLEAVVDAFDFSPNIFESPHFLKY